MNKETINYFESIFDNNERIKLLNINELNSFKQNFDIDNIQKEIFQNGKTIMDNWLTFYNSDNLVEISDEIKKSFKDFNNKINVYYYCGKKLVIKTDINTFLQNLFLFLEFDDDSPIVIFESSGYLLFTPLGKVLMFQT